MCLAAFPVLIHNGINKTHVIRDSVHDGCSYSVILSLMYLCKVFFTEVGASAFYKY